MILRQQKPEFELQAMFPTNIPLDRFKHNFGKTYGIHPHGGKNSPMRSIVFEIGTHAGRDGFVVEKTDYSDFLDAFFPIIHQDTKVKPSAGYKPSELSEIFISTWWKGNMGKSGFNDILKKHPNTVYMRRSGSNRSAFVIGFDHGLGLGPHLMLYEQSEHRVKTVDERGLVKFYRSIVDVYDRVVHELELSSPTSTYKTLTHDWDEPLVGAPVPDLDFEAHREISAVEEECDWSRWM